VTSGFAAGFGIKEGKFEQGRGRNLAALRFRTPEGDRQFLFQQIRTDAKRKDEHGKEITLKAGDIVQNSIVVPGRWWRGSKRRTQLIPMRHITTTTASSRVMRRHAHRQLDLG